MVDKFASVLAALSYYKLKNPARQRFINLLEPERGSPQLAEDFTTENPVFVWVNVTGAINAILSELDRDRRRAFILCELGDGETRLHPIEVARALRVHERTVFRWLSDIRERLERELKQRDLIS